MSKKVQKIIKKFWKKNIFKKIPFFFQVMIIPRDQTYIQGANLGMQGPNPGPPGPNLATQGPNLEKNGLYFWLF